MTDNSDFTKDFLAAYNDPKQSKKDLGRAIGLPDAQDEDFLKNLIAEYERQNPGWIAYMRDNARKMFAAGTKGHARNEDATVSKASGMTYDFELPPSLFHLIERYYPLMFKDTTHYHWFKRKFAVWMIRPNDKRTRVKRK